MSEHDTLPLADAPRLRRAVWRSKLASAATSLGIAAALAYCASSVLLQSGAAGAARSTRPTVVVLDVSGSIGPAASDRIHRLLSSVAAGAGGGAGLVLFSNTGYVALAPRSSPTQLRRYGHYFRREPSAQTSAPPPPTPSAASLAPTSTTPWGLMFSQGTSIASGLAAARQALARARIGAADVVVASDFNDDPSDYPALRRELKAFARLHATTLSIDPLPPSSTSGVALFRQFADGKATAYRPQRLLPPGDPPGTAAFAAPMTVWFLLAACLVLVAVAADGLLGTFLSWDASG